MITTLDMMIGALFPLSAFAGFAIGYSMGREHENKSCNDWWNQYGAQIWGPQGTGESADAHHAEPVTAKADPHQNAAPQTPVSASLGGCAQATAMPEDGLGDSSDPRRSNVPAGSDPEPSAVAAPLREWLVIDDSRKNGVFAPDEAKKPKGYIPRYAAEALLGRSMEGTQWFTKEEIAKMRAHAEWSTVQP